MVVTRTIGGPLRFRPKTREELQLEVSELHKKVGTLKRRKKKKQKREETPADDREGKENDRDNVSAEQMAQAAAQVCPLIFHPFLALLVTPAAII